MDDVKQKTATLLWIAMTSEWQLFLATSAASSLASLSPLLLSDRPLRLRRVIGTVVFYGCLGSSCSMVIGYEYLGWKDSPIKVLSMSLLVGLGAIKKADVTALVRRMFGLTNGHSTPPTKPKDD